MQCARGFLCSDWLRPQLEKSESIGEAHFTAAIEHKLITRGERFAQNQTQRRFQHGVILFRHGAISEQQVSTQ